MMDDQRDAYIAEHPEVLTMPLPDGWRRLDSMPLDCPLQFLMDDGSTHGGVGASNPAFLCDRRLHIAWQPMPLDEWLAKKRSVLAGRISEEILESECASIRNRYERNGWQK